MCQFNVKGLLIIKQRLSLPVLANHITFASDRYLLSERSGNCYSQGRRDKDRHNDKGENPLERNYLDTKLVNGKGYNFLSDHAQQ